MTTDITKRLAGEKHQASALPSLPQKSYGRPIGNPIGTQMEGKKGVSLAKISIRFRDQNLNLLNRCVVNQRESSFL